jgi:hypothetical protein
MSPRFVERTTTGFVLGAPLSAANTSSETPDRHARIHRPMQIIVFLITFSPCIYVQFGLHSLDLKVVYNEMLFQARDIVYMHVVSEGFTLTTVSASERLYQVLYYLTSTVLMSSTVS